MAIPTFVAGNTLTAAQLNTISTAFTITDAWTSFTPTLTQSGSVTKTVTYARYIKLGRLVTVAMQLDITGAGSSSNDIIVGHPSPVPVTATNNFVMGSGLLTDASSSTVYPFHVASVSTTTFKLLRTAVDTVTTPFFLGSAGFTVAFASGDVLSCTYSYEATA